VTRREQSCSAVTMYDTVLSDHKLLTWAVDGNRADPPAVTVNYRPWRAVSMEDLRAAPNASSLYMPDQWTARSVDDLALLHDTVFTELADRFAPLRQVTRRPRQSDPWFDADCRAAKRLTRRLARTAAKAERHGDNTEATDALEAWRAQCRVYRDLLRRKREGFWQSTVEAQLTNSQQLWKSIDTLLGRGRPPDQVEITAEEFQRFFEDKVAAVRSSTASAPKPDFVTGPPGVLWSVFNPVDCSEVANAIRQLPDKTCAVDPVPTSVLKQLMIFHLS